RISLQAPGGCASEASRRRIARSARQPQASSARIRPTGRRQRSARAVCSSGAGAQVSDEQKSSSPNFAHLDIGAGVNLEACEQPTRSPVARVSQPPARPRARGGVGQASGPGGGLCIPGPSTRKKSRRRQAAAKEDLRSHTRTLPRPPTISGGAGGVRSARELQSEVSPTLPLRNRGG
ncbi:unnamed protein product, partial [Prorocentrum cordatum]